jgi:diaminohydroxyphosphoribosylaminopyrimidine deaminase/5-amino-6-(5-phosphoribosylamino)uracil reductase
VVGEGFHRRAGEPHAERIALTAAGEAARGATAYVTLEPCCHHGRTPPCSEAFVAAGVAAVVSAMEDPNPKVSGQGHAQLAAAGIATRSGLFEEEARALNPGFVRRMQIGRPFVRCKLAMSLDGRTAMSSGESHWITSDVARRDVQRLRARSSAPSWPTIRRSTSASVPASCPAPTTSTRRTSRCASSWTPACACWPTRGC